VMQDNRYKTWDNYANEYWPAEYLIDRQGHVRHTNFGEGDYGGTENAIRTLLGTTGTRARNIADATPNEPITPESYLGYARLSNYVGTKVVPGAFATYRFPPSVPPNTLSYAGSWRVRSESITAGANARLRLHFQARYVYIVMGGHGMVQTPTGTIHVDAERLYTARAGRYADATLELRFSRGVQAYSFTFG
jgi:hypothetical protein